jgi:pSer/pThr/pTyr-binding forkhead associated (FHA) protein
VKLSVSKRNQPNQKIDLGQDVLAFDYSETVFLIGRSKDCHIVLDDKKISREHVRIIHKSGKWFAEKTSKENVGHHNGEDFDKVELQNGDTLVIAGYTINVENEEETKEFEKVILTEPPSPKMEPTNDYNKSASTPTASESDLTKEIAVEEIGGGQKVIVDSDTIHEVASSGEATSEIELPSDFQSFDHSEKSQDADDEFSSDDNSEVDAENALGLNADEVQPVSVSEPLADDENMSYSLENIDSEAEDESTRVIQTFAKIQLELFGETAPYDKYLIESEKTFIGRDPSKCQIVLNDTEVSSVHAVITKNNITVSIEDLNSSNGTILNGERINKAILGHNDEFVIGGVTFTVKFRSDYLKEENSTLMAVDENQTVEVEEIVEVQADEGEHIDALGEIVSNSPQEKSLIKRIWKDDEKRKKAIYVLVGIVAAYIFLIDDNPTPVAAPKKAKHATVKSEDKPIVNKTSGKVLSEDEKRAYSARYEIGKNHFNNGRYREALEELLKISAVDPNFNSSLQSLIALSKEGLSKLEEQEKKRIAEQASAEKKIKVKELVSKAEEFVKDRRVEMAQDVFNEIAKIDPENIDITKMKLELEDWQKEKSRKELEIVSKKKAREDKVEKLKPGKTLFLQKEWFKAISKLEDFLKVKDMDEDLTKEASDMLKTSRDEVSTNVAPLVGKAKSLMEGQDLKGAYEVYQQILKIEPSNLEALNQVGDIREQLANKARKVYREAIISESLSLFQDAKEKFQEVQQISPVDSDYYKKATDKLKDYLE